MSMESRHHHTLNMSQLLNCDFVSCALRVFSITVLVVDYVLKKCSSKSLSRRL
jgi:hypothetical protein